MMIKQLYQFFFSVLLPSFPILPTPSILSALQVSLLEIAILLEYDFDQLVTLRFCQYLYK